MWPFHRRALERSAAPTVVAGWRGSVQTARLLQGCAVEDLDETAARAAGLLLGSFDMPKEATGAVVGEGALRRRQPLVTSNRQQLHAPARSGRYGRAAASTSVNASGVPAAAPSPDVAPGGLV
jgi:hypothetical protein